MDKLIAEKAKRLIERWHKPTPGVERERLIIDTFEFIESVFGKTPCDLCQGLGHITVEEEGFGLELKRCPAGCRCDTSSVAFIEEVKKLIDIDATVVHSLSNVLQKIPPNQWGPHLIKRDLANHQRRLLSTLIESTEPNTAWYAPAGTTRGDESVFPILTVDYEGTKSND